jgi:hypothetical protein
VTSHHLSAGNWKRTKTSVRTVNVPDEIRTQPLSNISQKRRLSSQLAGWDVSLQVTNISHNALRMLHACGSKSFVNTNVS